ncbi:MAG: DUF192 domain-containing protein [Gammaproteobacteria bacterium]
MAYGSHTFPAILLLVTAVALHSMTLAAEMPENLPRSTLFVESGDGGRHRFDVRLARTPEQLARGLMFVTEMGEMEGMLFDFGRTRPAGMWMRNTVLPLDMVFVRADGVISNIAARTVPFSRTPILSDGPVRFVLEVHGGTCERLGIQPGDRITHPLIRDDRFQ